MDKWQVRYLEAMARGGNNRFDAYMRRHNVTGWDRRGDNAYKSTHVRRYATQLAASVRKHVEASEDVYSKYVSRHGGKARETVHTTAPDTLEATFFGGKDDAQGGVGAGTVPEDDGGTPGQSPTADDGPATFGAEAATHHFVVKKPVSTGKRGSAFGGGSGKRIGISSSKPTDAAASVQQSSGPMGAAGMMAGAMGGYLVGSVDQPHNGDDDDWAQVLGGPVRAAECKSAPRRTVEHLTRPAPARFSRTHHHHGDSPASQNPAGSRLAGAGTSAEIRAAANTAGEMRLDDFRDAHAIGSDDLFGAGAVPPGARRQEQPTLSTVGQKVMDKVMKTVDVVTEKCGQLYSSALTELEKRKRDFRKHHMGPDTVGAQYGGMDEPEDRPSASAVRGGMNAHYAPQTAPFVAQGTPAPQASAAAPVRQAPRVAQQPVVPVVAGAEAGGDEWDQL